jgi:hypothetical protein
MTCMPGSIPRVATRQTDTSPKMVDRASRPELKARSDWMNYVGRPPPGEFGYATRAQAFPGSDLKVEE